MEKELQGLENLGITQSNTQKTAELENPRR